MLLRKRRTIESTISPPKEVNIEQEQKRVVPVPNREGRQRLIYKINRATIDGNGIDGTDDDDDEDTKLAKQQMSRNQLATGKLMAQIQLAVLVLLFVSVLGVYIWFNYLQRRRIRRDGGGNGDGIELIDTVQVGENKEDESLSKSLWKALSLLLFDSNRKPKRSSSSSSIQTEDYRHPIRMVSCTSTSKSEIDSLLYQPWSWWMWWSSSSTKYLIPNTAEYKTIHTLLRNSFALRRSNQRIELDLYDPQEMRMFLEGITGRQCSAAVHQEDSIQVSEEDPNNDTNDDDDDNHPKSSGYSTIRKGNASHYNDNDNDNGNDNDNKHAVLNAFDYFQNMGEIGLQKQVWLWCMVWSGREENKSLFFVDLDHLGVELDSRFWEDMFLPTTTGTTLQKEYNIAIDNRRFVVDRTLHERTKEQQHLFVNSIPSTSILFTSEHHHSKKLGQSMLNFLLGLVSDGVDGSNKNADGDAESYMDRVDAEFWRLTQLVEKNVDDESMNNSNNTDDNRSRSPWMLLNLSCGGDDGDEDVDAVKKNVSEKEKVASICKPSVKEGKCCEAFLSSSVSSFSTTTK